MNLHHVFFIPTENKKKDKKKKGKGKKQNNDEDDDDDIAANKFAQLGLEDEMEEEEEEEEEPVRSVGGSKGGLSLNVISRIFLKLSR